MNAGFDSLEKSGEVDRDNFNKLNISRRVEKIIIHVAASTEEQDSTNRYLDDNEIEQTQ